MHLRFSRLAAFAFLLTLGALPLSACFGDGDEHSDHCTPFFRKPKEDCSVEGKRDWVHRLLHDAYLWRTARPDLDPRSVPTMKEVLAARRAPQDRFSRIEERQAHDDFFEQGKTFGLGMSVAQTADGSFVIALVYDGSPAEKAGLKRSQRIVAVNGEPMAQRENPWDLTPGEDVEGVEVRFTVQEPDGTSRELVAKKGVVFVPTVMKARVLDVGGKKVGYFLFLAFIQPSFAELKAGLQTLVDGGAEELVVDLRYNGGGLLAVAAALGGHLAPAAAGKPLAVASFNDYCSTLNEPLPISAVSPSLQLSRVTFIQGGDTWSASELTINGLRPYMPVTRVGGTTGGKPVGSHAFGYCDVTFSPITFEYLNANGEGRFYSGLEPDCVAPDDLGHDFGDPNEARLAAALRLLQGQSCEPVVVPQTGVRSGSGLPARAVPPRFVAVESRGHHPFTGTAELPGGGAGAAP